MEKINNFIKSPLNYTGGKFKLLPQITPLFPKKINTFVDLFCGGCNVGVNVTAKNKIFNDNQTFLIEIYQYIQRSNIDFLLNEIFEVISTYELSLTNEKGYNVLRNEYNNNKSPLLLLCLIFYSFNHGIRFNNKHDFNMPFGKNRSQFNPTIEKNLVSFKPMLENVILSNTDFTDFNIHSLNSDDFVYLDPPYLISTGTYNDGKRGFEGWCQTHESKLLDLMLRLNKLNVKFALSNVLHHKGQINDLLWEFIQSEHFNCVFLDKNYKNCSYQGLKTTEKTVEILLTNY